MHSLVPTGTFHDQWERCSWQDCTPLHLAPLQRHCLKLNSCCQSHTDQEQTWTQEASQHSKEVLPSLTTRNVTGYVSCKCLVKKCSILHLLDQIHTWLYPPEHQNKILPTIKDRQVKTSQLYTLLLKQTRRIFRIWIVQNEMFKNSPENVYDTQIVPFLLSRIQSELLRKGLSCSPKGFVSTPDGCVAVKH